MIQQNIADSLPTIIHNMKGQNTESQSVKVDLGDGYALIATAIEIMNTAFTLTKNDEVVWTRIYIYPFFIFYGWQSEIANSVINAMEINEYNVVHTSRVIS